MQVGMRSEVIEKVGTEPEAAEIVEMGRKRGGRAVSWEQAVKKRWRKKVERSGREEAEPGRESQEVRR